MGVIGVEDDASGVAGGAAASSVEPADGVMGGRGFLGVAGEALCSGGLVSIGVVGLGGVRGWFGVAS